jgi:hypothetical protein
MEKKSKAVKKDKKNPLSARDRCRAVLSVWSEHRKPSEVCRTLDIKWSVLQNWEQRSLEGMLYALQPKKKRVPGPTLSPRLVKLLKKTEEKEGLLEGRLEKRLAKIQASKSGQEATPTPIPPEKKKG